MNERAPVEGRIANELTMSDREQDLSRLRAICKAEFPLGFVPSNEELSAWLAIGDVDFVELLVRELARRFRRLRIRPRVSPEPDA